MPKTILIDATSQVGGGISLLKSLVKTPNHQYQLIICIAPQYASLFTENNNITVIQRDVGSTFSFKRLKWLSFGLFLIYKKFNADILFLMTPLYFGPPINLYSLIQNALPFSSEKFRYGFSIQLIRLLLLQFLIHLTLYRSRSIATLNFAHYSKFRAIYSGKDHFILSPANLWNEQPLPKLSVKNAQSLNILYISTVDVYKHHVSLIKAIQILDSQGLNANYIFAGYHYKPYLSKLRRVIENSQITSNLSIYSFLERSQLKQFLYSADIALFLSSCECFPNILLDYSAFNLPIICSSYSPMPQIMEKTCIYTDPTDSTQIAESIKLLSTSPDLRASLSNDASSLLAQYTDQRSSDGFYSSLKIILD